jgi:formylglycine-generating enzyme required for sulfatase activity
MKNFLTSLVILLATLTSFAQAPNRISYQAEVRNGSNNLVINQLVGIRISILQGSNVGPSVYTETHAPTTNANGLVSLQIGGGTTSGNFANINWANGPYFLKTETDPTGGTNYSISGTNQLLSVPYALFSNASNNGVPSGGSEGQVLTNCSGVAIWTTGGICPGKVTALNCSTTSNIGALTQGVEAARVSCSVPYLGGDGGAYCAQSIISTGVNGLTANLEPGTFKNGSGNLQYSIIGSPASSGIASFALYIGGQTCTFTMAVASSVGTITALTCASATNSGTLTQGIVAASVSSSIPYTGGNGGAHNGQTVNSTGVTGLTATCAAGTLATGSGNLTFTITGTPASAGTASFALNIGGKTCTLTRTVALPVGTITALSCSTATNAGTLGQGVVAASVSSTVPYIGGNGGTHTGQTVTSTGVTGLTATRAAANFATGSGTLVYIITGTPASSGTASFALNIGGQTCTLTRTVLASASITALNCSTATNNGTLGLGVAAASVSSSVPYTGGNGGYRAAQTFTSTGVTGLTATCAAGTLATGAGNLTFTITGTPATTGTASFALSVGGQTCTLTRTVLASASITALSCSTATNNGTLTQGIAAASVNSSVQYTGGNGGYRGSQTFTSTGVTGLTATCAAGTLATGAGSLTFTISGTPNWGGTASFMMSVCGQTCTLTRTVNPPAGTITALNCSTATNIGTLIQGSVASFVSSSVPYTGGNGGTYTAQTITSTGVTGLTATLTAGTFTIGAGSLTYTITGTPLTSGTASFALNIGGKTCTLTRAVLPIGTITALSCSGATNINALVQGIAAFAVSSNIPYTGGNGGSHTGQTVTSTGVTGLTATRAPGSFVTGSGTLVYTITGTPASSGSASFAINIGGQTCTLIRTVASSVGTIAALTCLSATNSGTLTQGIAAASVSSSIPYTGGNSGTHNGQTVNSTGVSGLTATLTAGTFAIGAGSLTYIITGTPLTSGTASFALNIGGKTCTLTRTVLPIGTITALNCSTATNMGTLAQGIAAASVGSTIPYTGGNGGTHSGQSITSTGVIGLTASLTAGTFAIGAGSLTYTITGTPLTSGTASFALNIGGKTCTLTRAVLPIGTITALSCSTATNIGTLAQGIAAASVSSTIPYTGGNSGTHTGQTVTSTGVTGLTATCAAGNFLMGSGTLVYTITGTPVTSGTASFALNMGGQICTLTRTVNLPPGTITALYCSQASGSGTLVQGVAASSVNSIVPYTGGNGGYLGVQTATSTGNAGGVTGLTATCAAGTLVTGAGSLTFTITGTPNSSGTASFMMNVAGQTCTLLRTVALPVGSITALNCSTATNTGTLTQSMSATSVSSSIPYTGGNGGTRIAQTIASTGVTGLTATCAAGNFAIGTGTLVYTITGTPINSGTATFTLNIGGQTCTLTRTVLTNGIITALNCSTATNIGILSQGIAAVNVSSSAPYTGGNGGSHSGQTITSTGVTGLTATLTAGNFAIGAGSLTYTITGTPTSIGTASFALNIGGKTCTLTRTVALPLGTITALSCSTASNAGTLGQGIAAAYVSSGVPYSGGNGGTHNGQTVNSTGVTGLTATRAAGNFATGSGALVYTITGTPATSGTASFALNLGGQTCTLTRTVSSASITALSCSTATNNGILAQGISASSVNSIVQYTGGNGGYSIAQTVTSTGVTGLTATCAAGTLANGAGSLTFTITGIPASSGTASFVLSIGGQTCTLNRTVLVSAVITGFNCASSTGSGTLVQGVAALSVNRIIPYTSGNGGYYSGQTVNSTGVTGLTATCTAGTLATGAGSLTYTITGTPAASGIADFALSLAGQTCSINLWVNPSLNIETVLIPAGTFTMGSPITEPQRNIEETQHQVSLSAYRMSKYETSNAKFAAFLNAKSIGSDGLYALGAYPTQVLIYSNTTYGLTWTGTQWQSVAGKENFPVVNITWYGAAEFATYAGGRLPSESQWEYACRANTISPFNIGACLNNTQANYLWSNPYSGCSNSITNYPAQTQAVNSYSPNAYGLYNMHGNVKEWCADWYGTYSTTAQTNPTGAATGANRVFRGGGWNNNAQSCRSAFRLSYPPVSNYNFIGFRVAFAP